jgi:hypothetical protein
MLRKFFQFIVVSLLITSPVLGYDCDLSICTIFQNDAPYLKEWIEFHRELGVKRFYLYNNLSTDNYKEVLKPYIKKRIVKLIDWPFSYESLSEWDQIQIAAYENAVKLSKGKTKWLAILDTDEFLFPVHDNSLPQFLRRFESSEEIGGICVNWVMYGTSHVAKIPEDRLLIETLVLSNGEGDNHFKSIVRPERVSVVCSPHYVRYKKGFSHFKPSGKRNRAPFVEIDNIRINHYWSRDEYYLHHIKIPRRLRWGTSPEECQIWGSINNGHYDQSIFRFIEPLRKRMSSE